MTANHATNDLRETLRKVGKDPAFQAKYPDGATGQEYLEAAQEMTGGFELCSCLDVIDELRVIYG